MAAGYCVIFHAISDAILVIQMATRNFRFHVFTVHGHLETGIPDYVKLFSLMTGLKGHYHQVGKRQIAVGTAKLLGNDLFLVIYSGNKEACSFLIGGNRKSSMSCPILYGSKLARREP